jgi:hypothetical protein
MVDCFRAFASHINVPKGNGDVYHELLKILAQKVILLLMIAINMLKLLKVLFLISMLIFVEYLDLVNRVTTRKIILFTTGMKRLSRG